MPKHCTAVGCMNGNFMHKKNLSFFRFPNKLKQSKRWEKWVQAVKRVNSDGSKCNGNLMEIMCIYVQINSLKTLLPID